MYKIPRDIDADILSGKLKTFGYKITRQNGSHIRLSSSFTNLEHNITIPNHNPIKIGTLSNIIKEIAEYLNIEKEELVKKLFY